MITTDYKKFIRDAIRFGDGTPCSTANALAQRYYMHRLALAKQHLRRSRT